MKGKVETNEPTLWEKALAESAELKVKNKWKYYKDNLLSWSVIAIFICLTIWLFQLTIRLIGNLKVVIPVSPQLTQIADKINSFFNLSIFWTDTLYILSTILLIGIGIYSASSSTKIHKVEKMQKYVSFFSSLIFFYYFSKLYDIHFIFPTRNTSSNANANTNTNFFDPIDVFPTTTQVENAIQITNYCDIVEPNNSSCPISLEPFNENSQVSMIRHCKHIFNTEQINLWFRSNCRCPVCRYDIRTYESSPILSIPVTPRNRTTRTNRNRSRPLESRPLESTTESESIQQMPLASSSINQILTSDSSLNIIIQDIIQEFLVPSISQNNLLNQGFSIIHNTIDPSNNIINNIPNNILRNLFLPPP